MNLLVKIPISIPDDAAGNFLEAQQYISDVFFRDLRSAKQFALLESFSIRSQGSPEQLAAMREALKAEIALIEKAMEQKSIELMPD